VAAPAPHLFVAIQNCADVGSVAPTPVTGLGGGVSDGSLYGTWSSFVPWMPIKATPREGVQLSSIKLPEMTPIPAIRVDNLQAAWYAMIAPLEKPTM